MKHQLSILSLALLPLITSCSVLGIEEAPVGVVLSTGGSADVISDFDSVLILGSASVTMSVIERSSGLAAWTISKEQTNSDLSWWDGGEIHHHAFGSFLVPLRMLPFMGPALLVKYPLLLWEPAP